MKTEISRVFRKNALVFLAKSDFCENRFFLQNSGDKQDNIDLNGVFAAPLSEELFRRPVRAAPENRPPHMAGRIRGGRPSPRMRQGMEQGFPGRLQARC